jgi:hypothetical protein
MLSMVGCSAGTFMCRVPGTECDLNYNDVTRHKVTAFCNLGLTVARYVMA